jgi:hypothetical protein
LDVELVEGLEAGAAAGVLAGLAESAAGALDDSLELLLEAAGFEDE